MNQPASAQDEIIPTRRSLLSRIKDPGDQQSWRDFYDTYHGLIRSAALRAGLASDQAEDVIQDTLITVSRTINRFNTDPARGSFKSWLFMVTRSRIEDFRRKHRRAPLSLADMNLVDAGSHPPSTLAEHRIPDAAPPPDEQLDRAWDESWNANVQAHALEKFKRKVKAHHFQIFFLYVIKGFSVRDVARQLGVGLGQVYLVKHRFLSRYRQALREAETHASAPRVPAISEDA